MTLFWGRIRRGSVHLGGLVVVLVGLPAVSAPACEPTFYLLLGDDAREHLAPLVANPAPSNRFERVVLMHNLAFHKDKKMRKSAEKLMDAYGPDSLEPPRVEGFRGSLQMIRISHSSTGSKIFRTLSPFSKSPHAEARAGYRRISEAVARDSTNYILHLLRSTAATESAEHLNELYDSAQIDLAWMRRYGPSDDSAVGFMVHLNWTKYYYKLARYEDDISGVDIMQRHMERASGLACTQAYAVWARLWEERVAELVAETEVSVRGPD